MSSVYLDYNATTPLESEVLVSISSALRDAWGNPSSGHKAGVKAKHVINEARSQVAEMIGASPAEVIFTSGGTESNNMVIFSALQYFYKETKNIETVHDVKHQHGKPHIITTIIEHDSVKIPLEVLVNEGKAEVTIVPVSKLSGHVVVADILNAIKPNTCLISIMLANNETGIIQPVDSLGIQLQKVNDTRSRSHPPLPRVLYHSDAAQAIGKISVDVQDLFVDYLTVVGHKFYGPRIGALYFRSSGPDPAPLYPTFFGGGQERKYRPGTENTGMIAGLGKAAELVNLNLSKYKNHMTHVRNYLESSLEKAFGSEICFNNRIKGVERLPNTTSVAFCAENITGNILLSHSKDVCVSTGAACHQGIGASPILIASGVSKAKAERTLRLSVGRETTTEDIDRAVANLKHSFNTIRADSI